MNHNPTIIISFCFPTSVHDSVSIRKFSVSNSVYIIWERAFDNFGRGGGCSLGQYEVCQCVRRLSWHRVSFHSRIVSTISLDKAITWTHIIIYIIFSCHFKNMKNYKGFPCFLLFLGLLPTREDKLKKLTEFLSACTTQCSSQLNIATLGQ